MHIIRILIKLLTSHNDIKQNVELLHLHSNLKTLTYNKYQIYQYVIIYHYYHHIFISNIVLVYLILVWKVSILKSNFISFSCQVQC